MPINHYAHSLECAPKEDWQTMESHLKGVAELSGLFGSTFGAKDWAYLVGLWHDIGKYSQEFQNRLCNSEHTEAHIESPGRVDHSTAGAQHAIKSLGKMEGKLLAYTIAGHHAGLPDGKANNLSCLAERLVKKIPDYSDCPSCIGNRKKPCLPDINFSQHRYGFQVAFFIRMIFSCLVDADFLDTESFLDREKACLREGYPALDSLWLKLERHLNQLIKEAKPSKINLVRKNILGHCINLAEKRPGLFSLTVPTGGGKTLSSLAFGLRHAILHGLSRIIFVVPYTSIIEQNAEVFRKVLGEDSVLEHHINFEPEKEDRRSRLAAENWDAPIIVTTSVQFFESLFANRSSRCRKLHNIAKSVIILDEAQMIPVRLLRPCLEAIRELAENYRSTVLLCTATQPALASSQSFKNGLDNVTECMPDPIGLYRSLKRVKTKLDTEPKSDEDLAQDLSGHSQVLCIVNTRGHARALYEKLKGICSCYHLSALMCPAHRSRAISEIRAKLKSKEPCRVISTQLVECGVDISFPYVYRAVAGIDSIAQAAGRCNREGENPDGGIVTIFRPQNVKPHGDLVPATSSAEEALRLFPQDPLSLESVEKYFQTLYFIAGDDRLDKEGIVQAFNKGFVSLDFPFNQVASSFQLIPDGMESVIVPYDEEASHLINILKYGTLSKAPTRKIQRYAVSIRPGELIRLTREGHVQCFNDRFNVLMSPLLYRQDIGLDLTGEHYQAEDLIA